MRIGSSCVTVTLTELLLLSKNAREISLSNFISSGQKAGQQHSRLLGRGMEFAESRRYAIGDESRNIDWRVTARTGHTHTKLFTAEKEREVHLFIDMRSNMFFATKGVFKAVQAALMGATIAWNSVLTGNKLGGVIFNDSEHFECRPCLGKRGVLPFLEKLSEMFTKQLKGAAHSAMDAPLERLQRVVPTGSLVFIMSDFRHFSENHKQILLEIAKHSEIRLLFFYDPIEVSLPRNGLYPISEGETNMLINTFDKSACEQYRQQFVSRKNHVVSMSHYKNIRFMECKTEDDYLTLLRSS